MTSLIDVVPLLSDPRCPDSVKPVYNRAVAVFGAIEPDDPWRSSACQHHMKMEPAAAFAKSGRGREIPRTRRWTRTGVEVLKKFSDED